MNEHTDLALDVSESEDYYSCNDSAESTFDVEIGDLNENANNSTKPEPSSPTENSSEKNEHTETAFDNSETEREETETGPPLETYACCSCFEEFTSCNAQGCSNSEEKHYMCPECKLMYLRTELGLGHAFDSRRWMGGKEESAIVSESGQLPCPLFVTGDCDCGAMPLAGLYSLLSVNEETAHLFNDAFRRVVEAETRREIPLRADANTRNHPARQERTVKNIHRAVLNTIDEASLMRCPDCGFPGLKDGACMHIRCEGPACNTQWCYCCGRRRRGNSPDTCRGCDARNCYLEKNPGWGHFAIAGETPGIGARNEFHRQRTRYCVQRIKNETPVLLWEEFQSEHPTILTGVPTDGRFILWDELDDPMVATPPLFGNSTEDDLLWKLPPREENADNDNRGRVAEEKEEEEQQQRPPQQQRQQAELPTMQQVLQSNRGVVLGCALTFVLLVVRWSLIDPLPGFKVLTDILVAAVAYCGLAFGLLRTADNLSLHRDWIGFHEVQIFGSQLESPYLSQEGRWNIHRDIYVRFFLGGISLGSLLVGTSNNFVHLQVACRVAGTIVLTLVLTLWFLLTFFVNHSAPPLAQQNEERVAVFRKLQKVLFGWSLIWAVGLGLSVSESAPVTSFGKILSRGLAGVVAEMAPRLARDDGHPLWDTLDRVLHLQCYTFFVCLAVGPTLVTIGNSSDAQVARIFGILICLGAPIALVWFCVNRRR